MHPYQREEKHEARRKAERFFRRLRRNAKQSPTTPIVVHYTERFRTGRCLMAVIIPTAGIPLRLISEVGMAHQKYYYPPRILNNRNGTCLRLVYRLQKIKEGELRKVLKCTEQLADWAEKIFGKRTTVSPFGGPAIFRWKLRTPRP